MDYEKKYKEAFSKAKDNYKAADSADINVNSFKATLIDLFPELRKSDDECIRGAIIHFISHTPGVPMGYIDKKTMLDWLEKQGEQKQDPCKNCKDVKLNCHNFPCIEKRAFKQGKSALEAIKEEKVDNQICVKPNDKVESKFKVKYAGREYNVLEVKDSAGITFYGIEDEPNHIDYIKAENCEIISGYAIKDDGSPYPTKPAVFSEQKSAIEMKSAEESLCISTEEYNKIVDECLYGDYSEQISTWSEEDEMIALSIEQVMNCAALLNIVPEKIDKIRTWLRTLKNRVGCEANCTTTWKPSDEQIEALESATENCAYSEYQDCLRELIFPLKKLREK